MKIKFVLLAVLALCLSATLQAQTLVNENNLWSNLIEVSHNNYTLHFQQVKGDTIINSKACKKLMGSTSALLTNWKYEAALREPVPGKVYIINAGSTSEHLLYDFTLTVNSTFTGYYKECMYQMNLDAIENIYLLNGETRKQFQFSGTGASGFFTENWINEIGSDNGLTSAGIYSCTYVSDTAPTLNCFTENSIVKVYNNADFPCFSFVGIADDPASLTSQVNPNPVVDIAVIQLQDSNASNLRLVLFNSHGQKAAEFQYKKGNQLMFKRDGLPGGVYFYEVKSGTTQISKGKFIIR